MRATHAVLAARRYYLDGWTIKRVAAELGISRFKVARLLEWARGEGLVRIEIVNTTRTDPDLSASLRHAYGLADALVVADLDGPADAVARDLAEVAALAVAELLSPHDVVGISWGRTLDQLVEQLPDCRAHRIVQLVGGLATLSSASSGIELVRRFAAKAHATGYPLLAPLLVRDAAAAASLRTEPVVAEALRLIGEVTVVIGGIGSWGEQASSQMHECFSADELDELERRGVRADSFGFLFDAGGALVPLPVGERIGIGIEQLRAVRLVIAVAGGIEKRRAVAAALAAGFVDMLITDAGTAAELVAAAGPGARGGAPAYAGRST